MKKILKNWAGTKPLLYRRYIDDVFFVWPGSTEELEAFISHMNSQSPFIKFTSSYDPTTKTVPFLDILVSEKNGKIETDLYKKETFRPQYLHPTSCHVGHQYKNIPYSLGLRCRRICSSDEKFELRLSELKSDLVSRQYHEKIIDEAFKKVRQISREKALQKVVKSENSREILSITFHPSLPSIQKIVKKHWEVMVDSNQNLKRCFSAPPMIAYRRGKNLRDHIIKAKVSSKRRSSRRKNGSKPCGQGCQSCWVLKTSKTHTNPRTKQSWPINPSINCNSTNCIYKGGCSKRGCEKWSAIDVP